MDLWLSFLNFSKRHQTLEEVLRSYGRAVDLLGSDWRAPRPGKTRLCGASRGQLRQDQRAKTNAF